MGNPNQTGHPSQRTGRKGPNCFTDRAARQALIAKHYPGAPQFKGVGHPNGPNQGKHDWSGFDADAAANNKRTVPDNALMLAQNIAQSQGVKAPPVPLKPVMVRFPQGIIQPGVAAAANAAMAATETALQKQAQNATPVPQSVVNRVLNTPSGPQTVIETPRGPRAVNSQPVYFDDKAAMQIAGWHQMDPAQRAAAIRARTSHTDETGTYTLGADGKLQHRPPVRRFPYTPAPGVDYKPTALGFETKQAIDPRYGGGVGYGSDTRNLAPAHVAAMTAGATTGARPLRFGTEEMRQAVARAKATEEQRAAALQAAATPSAFRAGQAVRQAPSAILRPVVNGLAHTGNAVNNFVKGVTGGKVVTAEEAERQFAENHGRYNMAPNDPYLDESTWTPDQRAYMAQLRADQAQGEKRVAELRQHGMYEDTEIPGWQSGMSGSQVENLWQAEKARRAAANPAPAPVPTTPGRRFGDGLSAAMNSVQQVVGSVAGGMQFRSPWNPTGRVRRFGETMASGIDAATSAMRRAVADTNSTTAGAGGVGVGGNTSGGSGNWPATTPTPRVRRFGEPFQAIGDAVGSAGKTVGEATKAWRTAVGNRTARFGDPLQRAALEEEKRRKQATEPAAAGAY